MTALQIWALAMAIFALANLIRPLNRKERAKWLALHFALVVTGFVILFKVY